MRDEDALLAALCDDGTDGLVKLALADLFEERGEPARAACMRWCAENERRPSYSETTETYDWWAQIVNNELGCSEDRAACVPDDVIDRTRHSSPKDMGTFWVGFETRPDAWRALLAAWPANKEANG